MLRAMRILIPLALGAAAAAAPPSASVTHAKFDDTVRASAVAIVQSRDFLGGGAESGWHVRH